MTSIETNSVEEFNSGDNKVAKNITWESISRFVSSAVHVLLVGVISHVQTQISFERVKASIVLAIICLVASIMAIPIRAFSVPTNPRLFQALIITDVIVTVFLLAIAIAFTTCIRFVHQLSSVGAIPISLYHLCLAVVVLSWVSIFFHSTVVLGLLLIYRNSSSACKNQDDLAEDDDDADENDKSNMSVSD